RAAREQTPVHVFVFTRQQPLACAPERRHVKSDFLDRRAPNDRVATHQNPRIVLVIRNDFAAGVNQSDNALVVRRQPRRRFAFPFWNVWTTDEVNVRARESLVDDLIPRLVDLFVVVDKPDEVTLTRRDPRVQRRGSTLRLFEDIMQSFAELWLPTLDHC